VLVTVAAVALVAIGVALVPAREWTAMALGVVRESGRWGAVAYAALFAMATMVAVPTTPLLVLGGLLFGLPIGAAVGVAASSTASVVSFLVARYVARDWVEAKVKRMPKWEALLEVVEEEGFKVVLLARLNPLLPSSVKNWGFGVTDVPLLEYVAASILGQAPFAVVYAYLGSVGGHAILRGEPGKDVDWLVIGIGFAISALLAGVLVWYGKRKLEGMRKWKRARATA
jgi:uncharacterized membrane protein YdjX (TVP38/TMEM64 family)